MSTWGRASTHSGTVNDFAGNIWVGSKYSLADPGAGNVARVTKLSWFLNCAAGIKARAFITTVDGSGVPNTLKAISAEVTTPNNSGAAADVDFTLAVDLPGGSGAIDYFLALWVDLGGGNHVRPGYVAGASGVSRVHSETYSAVSNPTMGAATADTPQYDVLGTYTVVSASSRKTESGIAIASVKTFGGIASASVKTLSGVT